MINDHKKNSLFSGSNFFYLKVKLKFPTFNVKFLPNINDTSESVFLVILFILLKMFKILTTFCVFSEKNKYLMLMGNLEGIL